MGQKLTKPYRLLVEGKNDQHVVWNLADRLKLKETFDVEAKDSYPQLIEALPTLLKSTNTLKRVGVVVDADENGEAHWRAIRTILGKSGYYSSLPETLPQEGLVCHPDDEEQAPEAEDAESIGQHQGDDGAEAGVLRVLLRHAADEGHERFERRDGVGG